MIRFDRQQRIHQWDQDRFTQGGVLVNGRDWLGTFTVWSLSSLGVGTILWLGKPCGATQAMAEWFLSEPSPFPGCRIYECPFSVEYGMELNWAVEETRIHAFLNCVEDAIEQKLCRTFARERQIPWLAGRTVRGGWFSNNDLPDLPCERQQPVIAMIVAALLADATRQTLCPLAGDLLPPTGCLGLSIPSVELSPDEAIVVGIGAIGTYLATLLAALGRQAHEVRLVDFDRVEDTNLNRQGLFTPDDALKQAYKSEAARKVLSRWFPEGRMSAEVCRVEPDYRLTPSRRGRTILFSAVDNAASRLVLQGLGRQLALNVIHGGTSTFAADCYVQGVGGVLLDDQMHGALTKAAAHEQQRRRGGCAADPNYVVPGMMAAGLMAYRFLQILLASSTDMAPLHWRSGSLPMEQRRKANVFDFEELAV